MSQTHSQTQNHETNQLNKKLSFEIAQIKDPQTQILYKKLVNHYYLNKNVKAKAIHSILFGDSLFLKPEHPPLIGPGIVSSSKPLRFVLPQARVKKILDHFAQHNSNFCIRFISNADFQKDSNTDSLYLTIKKQQQQQQKQTRIRNEGFVCVTINGSKFILKTDRAFQVDLGLFDTEQNEITFQAIHKLEETIVVFQHMKHPDTTYIANSISKKNTISKQNMIKQLKSIFLPNKKQSQIKSQTQQNIEQNIEKENQNESQRKEKEKEKQSLIISLQCSLSGKTISIPSRGRKCQHLQCFDLEEFLINSEERNNLVCPCCNQPISYSDLIVDGLLQDILKKEKILTTQKIRIFSDGKWETVSPPQKKVLDFKKQTNQEIKKEEGEKEKEKEENVKGNQKEKEKENEKGKEQVNLTQFSLLDIISQRKRKGVVSKNSISSLDSNLGKFRRRTFEPSSLQNSHHQLNIFRKKH
ncbi:zinc finger miz domain-containing protein [Anaeramoeba flamelloides]|uniref:Zinc finger miz domain-containing protein n=1 Tax=Anaeramoeba flamelloides TaxID=1746091 RepID=A0AAV7Y6Y3_9EUKA|nr:zinc finger miz domain-containing protein [Anaeramoeba flamelloides]